MGSMDSYTKVETRDENGRLTGLAFIYKCGCVRQPTVLSDGSIGWGEVWHYCPDHAYDEDGNLK